MKRLAIIAPLLIAFSSLAQDLERDKLKENEQRKEMEKARIVRQELDSGIYFSDREQYERADEKYRYALTHMKSVPSDLAFHFGKNSYLMGKYKQSVDWLTKYIQLKGTTGQYSSEATGWLKKAEDSLLAERQSESAKAAQVLSQDFTIDCGPTGKVSCPVCNGTTVIIRKDYFGDVYKACPYCNKLGYLTCEDYNKLIRGQLKAAVPK